MKPISFVKVVFNSRLFILSISFILELLFIIVPNIILSHNFISVYLVSFINFIFILYIINKKKNNSFKFAWIVVLCVFPFVGFIVYLIFADKRIPKKLSGYSKEAKDDIQKFIKKSSYDVNSIKPNHIRKQYGYVENFSYFPCFVGTSCVYFSSGRELFEDLIKRIDNAKDFIFMEFFIVKKGYMFNKLCDSLRKKVDEGVKVCFMLDDLGCLPYNSNITIKKLESIGVEVAVFSKVGFPTIFKTSYRDHRKIVVIDNEYAYTGGINIADEYIDREFPYGRWKDSGICISGKAVSSYTLMFIHFYNYSGNYYLNPLTFLKRTKKVASNSYILPFSDSPTDDERTGRNIQLNMINNASKYIFISTPYLIIDDEFENALSLKAKTGVRVVITVPNIPDKKVVSLATKSHYEVLIKNGVEIYEYIPGFMHSKLILCDDEIALEGSINMDFRSHFLQFESGCLIAKDDSIFDMKNDYLDTLKVSRRINLIDVSSISMITKLARAIANLFSPLF